MLAGQVIVGLQQSATYSGNEQVAVLLARSVAMQLTVVVVRTVNRVPDSGQLMLLIPEASVALTSDENVTVGVGVLSLGCVVYVKLIGQTVNMGGTVS